MRQIGNAVPVALAEKMGHCMIAALSSSSSKTMPKGESVISYRYVPVQLRLAIEKRKGYKGAEKNGKGEPNTKDSATSRRMKSVKARYAKKKGGK